MKLGLQISEKEYRELPYPSYSLLSGVSKNGPIALYGESIDISDLDAIIVGSIVDSLITDGGPPDNLVIVNKKPSNKALEIIKALGQRDDLKNSYLLSIKNKDLIEEECNKLEYYPSGTLDTKMNALKKYNKYIKAVEKHGTNAVIVSSYQYYQANIIANNLFLKYPWLKNNNIINQVKIIGEINQVKIKGMLDFIVVDDVNKTITPFDLKTGIGPHNEFFVNGFLNWGYYIQASLYKELLKQYIQNTKYKDYDVLNFKFMYCGRKDKLPIIYNVTDKWHEAGLKGFIYEDKIYDGVYKLIEDFTYYKQNPKALYRKGYDKEIIDFDDDLCKILVNGK